MPESLRNRPIRLALLGSDESTLGIARAAIEDTRFELLGLCEAEAELVGEGDFAVQLMRIANWESLLDSQQVDAVVVARSADEDRRAEHLRKLAQTAVPALVSHPVNSSMLIYYELDMIRRETGALLIPALPYRRHPIVRTLAHMVRQPADSPIGNVEQFAFERHLAGPTRESVARQFARDVDLVRAVCGDMTRLGAMAATQGPSAYTSLGVQMSGPGNIAARWSVAPADGQRAARMTLSGAQGRAVVTLPAGQEPWTLTVADGPPQSFEDWDASQATLDQLVDALQGAPPDGDWVDAARDVELSETIDRSLAKNRTIELHFEEYTEEGTFKGTMTSLGCGLLLFGMFVLALVGLAEPLEIPFLRERTFWPYVLLGLFVVFLLLQLVMLTSGKRDARSPDAGNDSSAGDAASPAPQSPAGR